MLKVFAPSVSPKLMSAFSKQLTHTHEQKGYDRIPPSWEQTTQLQWNWGDEIDVLKYINTV